MAEVLASLHVAKFNRGLRFVDYECCIGKNCRNSSKFWHILNEIIVVMNKLRHWQIYHVKNEANYVAHGLVKVAGTHAIDRIYLE